MIFSLVSLVSFLVFFLPFTALAAPAAPLDGELEARGYGKTHVVTVGKKGKLRYDPQYVHAKKGDYIKFEFHPKNHTVTESSFNYPCSKLGGGFATGFVPVDQDEHYFPTRNFYVKDAKPHWFYCGQVGHCPAGMVFAVNPPKKGNTFKKFQKMAMQSDD
ncbi:hypothetical protein FRC12_005776 [Ceratobasidium sp. 428]|nr:hypothetical protein FRC12_005776 [Ceratobasidium sp. 428]